MGPRCLKWLYLSKMSRKSFRSRAHQDFTNRMMNLTTSAVTVLKLRRFPSVTKDHEVLGVPISLKFAFRCCSIMKDCASKMWRGTLNARLRFFSPRVAMNASIASGSKPSSVVRESYKDCMQLLIIIFACPSKKAPFRQLPRFTKIQRDLEHLSVCRELPVSGQHLILTLFHLFVHHTMV